MSALPDVLLIGSYCAANTEQAMLEMATGLTGLIKRLPDGEVGARDQWIGWQENVLKDNPQFVEISRDDDAHRRDEDREKFSHKALSPRYRLSSRRGEINLPSLGYAAESKRSYDVFSRLKRDGRIPSELRFQISLPTTIAFLEHLIVTSDQGAVEPAYEHCLFKEVERIANSVPSEELSIQWDVSKEMAIWEGVWPIYFENPKVAIIERLIRHATSVPQGAELGFHFCYGDFGNRHWKEPDSVENMVQVANSLFERSPRKIDWIHMPVPVNRYDENYFRPLAELRLPSNSRLYLGVVHLNDGVEGTIRRVTAAQSFVSEFGIATECGMGRRPANTMENLLAIHRQVCVFLREAGRSNRATHS